MNIGNWLGVICLSLVLIQGQLKADNHMKVNGEGRVRWENRNNQDFVSNADDKMNDIFSRFRIGMNFTADKAKLTFEPQFSKTWGTAAGTSSGTTAHGMNIYRAQMEYALADMVDITVGRQELSYGDQLVLGSFDWDQNGRVWDAFKMRFKYGPGWTDVIYGKIANGNPPHDLYGIYNGWGFGGAFKEVDLYVLHSANGSTTQHTSVGARLKSDIDSIDYRAESTVQMQKGADTEFQADGEVGFTFVPEKKTRLAAGFFYASKAYNQMYPDVHGWLGMLDAVTRTNIMGPRVEFGTGITDTISVDLAWHMFNRTKNTVTSQGFGAATTNNGFGNEFDLVFHCNPSDSFYTDFGAGLLMPGSMVEASTGATNKGTQTFFYLQMGLKV